MYASQTTDTQVNVGKIFLHLFLFGGLVALIVYCFKVSSNNIAALSKKIDEQNEKINDQKK